MQNQGKCKVSSGEVCLTRLLKDLGAELLPGEYVYCSFSACGYGDRSELEPLASFQEKEGLSLLLPRQQADGKGLQYSCVLRAITLSVNSNLEAVGFTAEISRRLADSGIPANVIAGCHHDHIFVPADRAEIALDLLKCTKDL